MCFVASDSGLPGNNHPDALALAAKALRAAGFTEKELNMMFKDNPAKLVKLPVLNVASGVRPERTHENGISRFR